MDLSKFHVITVLSNPFRYKSRKTNFDRFRNGILEETDNLHVVELIAGRRETTLTDPKNDKHIQLWGSSLTGDIWQKEAMMNVAVEALCRNHPDWQYLMWIDADILMEPGWARETVEALQHFHVVQGFSHAVDLGPNKELIQVQNGFVYSMQKRLPHTKAYDNYHSGFCWAIRRTALNQLGGFIDTAILGSADRYMASAMYGKLENDILGFDKFTEDYNAPIFRWQGRAHKYVQRNVGYVPQTIRHLWHGRKKLRGYGNRFKLLQKYKFSPETDLKRDVNGLWQLVVENPRQAGFRDECRAYMKARHEDSTDLE